MMKKQYDIDCNIAQTLNLIGDKWTLLILHAVKVEMCIRDSHQYNHQVFQQYNSPVFQSQPLRFVDF